MNPDTALDRRTCLRFGACLPWLALAPRELLAARTARERAERCLVVLELAGGNDGFGTLVPFADDRYQRARPRLALSKSRVLALDELHGFHPALRQLRARFDRGDLAVVRGVGSPRPSLSHFKSQDAWASASIDDVPPPTGWVGRLRDVAVRRGAWAATPLDVCAVGRDLPPDSFAAASFVAPACLDFRAFADSPRERRAALELASPKLATLAAAARAARSVEADLSRAAAVRTFGAYPATALGDHARMAAQIRIAGLSTRVVWITTPSFDTHTRQAREHAILLERLDLSLAALVDDLERAGLFESTTIATVSEFGRRLAESGVGDDAGTDHGTASVAFALGGGVRGGCFGEASDLGELDGDGNPRATVDFRDYLGELVETLGLAADDVIGSGRRAVGFTRRHA